MEKRNLFIQGETVFSEDYQKLLSSEKEDPNTVIIKTEWVKEGDNFTKFSLYNNNYSPVIISSSTSLISEI